MYWQSIGYGILGFFNWHIVIGVLAICIMSLFTPVAVGIIGGHGKSGMRQTTGFLTMIIGGPIIQAIAMSLFILFFLPAILGNGGFTPYSIMQSLFWPIAKTGTLSLLLVL